MRLNALQLRNFRPYYGEVSLQFPDDVAGEVFLIHGPNGFGKTSLHTAVQWALYGESGRRELYDHANTRARREADFELAVTLLFEHEGKDYQLERRARATTTPVEKLDDLARSVLTLYRGGVPVAGEQEVAQDRINHMIPRDASQFFFFDGELIGRYSSSQQTEATRRAIELVLGLRAAQNARDDAAALEKDIRKRRNASLAKSEEHRQSVEEQERLQAELDAFVADVEELSQELAQKVTQRGEFRNELEQLAEVEVHAKRRAELVARRKKVEGKREDVIGELQDESKGLYLRLLLPNVVEAHDKCVAEYESTRELDTRRRMDASVGSFLRDLAEEPVCVCARSTGQQESAAIMEVAATLQERVDALAPEVAVEVTAMAARLTALREARTTAERAAHRFEDLKVQKVDLDEELSELDTAVAQVDNEMRSIDVESVNGLRDLVERLDKEVSLGDREIAGSEREISQRKDEIAKLDKVIARAGSASAVVRALEAQLELLERTRKAFDAYLLRAAQERRQQIEQEANGFFRSLTNKDEGYRAMFINDDFTFHVEASDGTRPNMDQISEGEKQVVAFSFIMGLSQYTQAKAPLMIDTPMGRLDEVHRRNLAQALATLEHQVFLLMTDTDMGFGVEEILAPAVEREFEIVHDQSSLSSTLRVRGESS